VSENGQVSFERDIRPLFRDVDRDAMEGAFDLWDHGDVSANAEAILTAVDGGGMPCDGPWPPERVLLFRRWVAEGLPE
jgi:hypothetical protein